MLSGVLMLKLTETGLFVSPDGFCGEHSRVVEQMSVQSNDASSNAEDRIQVAATNLEKGVYQCSDGWQGSWSQALDHESKLDDGCAKKGEDRTSTFQPSKLYACRDEWRGPLEAALAHEKELVATSAIIEAVVGSFRGTFEDLLARETAQAQPAQVDIKTKSVAEPSVLDTSKRSGQSRTVPGASNDRVLMRIYEAEDGFRGTYEEVLDHEQKMGLTLGHEKPASQGGAHDVVLMRIYEAPDGFRGTHDEVLAHEKALDMKNGKYSEGAPADDHVLMRLFEAPDGFRGTYEEVEAHEKKFGHTMGSDSEFQLSVYEAPDGFLGTYEEVLAHEAALGHKYCDTTGNVVAIDAGPSAESVLAADGVGLEQFVQPLHRLGVDSAAELKGCHDEWLIANLNMTEAQLAKFREAAGPNAYSSDSQGWVEASDGFRGSKMEVAAHEGKLQKQPKNGAPGDRTIVHLYEVRVKRQCTCHIFVDICFLLFFLPVAYTVD